MKLLIVDDEIFAIQGIMQGVNWEVLDYDEVLQANSYARLWRCLLRSRLKWCCVILKCRMRAGWS